MVATAHGGRSVIGRNFVTCIMLKNAKINHSSLTTWSDCRLVWHALVLPLGDARAQWAIDHVMIGRGNLLGNGFHDTFNSDGGGLDFFAELGDSPSEPVISDEWWYRVVGGQIGTFWGCGNPGATDITQSSLVFDTPTGGFGFSFSSSFSFCNFKHFCF